MQDKFPLPDVCVYAIPYFETSDILREFALTLGDLVAAYYVRKLGVQICIRTCSNLNDNEKAYVEQIINKLVGQLEEMKKLYDVNETIGTQVLREKIKSAYYACIQYKGCGKSVMDLELAFLYSQVVIYLNTLNSLTILTSEEQQLLSYCKYQASNALHMPQMTQNQSIRSRLGFKEEEIETGAISPIQEPQLNTQPEIHEENQTIDQHDDHTGIPMDNQNSSLEPEQPAPIRNSVVIPLPANNQMDHPSTVSQSGQVNQSSQVNQSDQLIQPTQSILVQSIPIQPMPVGQSNQSDHSIPIQPDQSIPIQSVSIPVQPNQSVPVQSDHSIPIQPNQSGQPIVIEVDDNSTNSVVTDIPEIPSFASLTDTVNSTFSQFAEGIDDEEIDVEAELNLPPPPSLPPVVQPDNEADKQKLQELLTQAVSIIDSIPREEETERIKQLDTILKTAQVYAYKLYICLFINK